MTAYQVMPGLTADEYADLRDDIAANGVRVPVDVDENGQVLDGHHRALIAAELGIECPRRVLAGLSEDEKVAHAYAVNIQRRSLTREQKRALVAASLRRDPALSDREHAKRTGVSHPTVADVRDELEQSGDVESSSTRVDALGRQQPSTKPQPTKPADWSCHCGARFKTAHTHCATCGDHYPEPIHCPTHTATVDLSTGEILTRDDATARFPVLDVPGADDDAVVDIANQVLTHSEDKQDYRAEQGAKWLAAQARKKDQPRDEQQTPIAASHFHRLAEGVVLLDRHATAMADAYHAADPLRREVWAGAVDALLDRLTSLSVQMSSTPALRSVK